MKKIIALIISLLVGTVETGVTPNIEKSNENQISKVYISNVKENGDSIINVKYKQFQNTIRINQEDFNTHKKEGEEIKLSTIDGKFHGSGKWYKDENFSEPETYYQFKSHDNSVWWALTLEEMGFVPLENMEYTLMYYDNGTTKENINCGCLPEYECECEVYDDIFLGIIEKYKTIEER